MSSPVQSPVIGNALRSALFLDGAGRLPVDVAMTVVPVAIVADVTRQVALDPVTALHMRRVSQVAGEYSRAGFQVQNNTTLAEVYLRRLTITSTVGQELWCGFSGELLGVTQDGLPRRKRTSLSAAALSGRMIGDTTATVPTVANYQMIVGAPAGQTVVIDFLDAPVIFDNMISGSGTIFVVSASAVNTTIAVTAQWEEVPRVN